MNVEEICREMSLKEKAAFCSGRDFWHTKAIERLGAPSVMIAMAPTGFASRRERETTWASIRALRRFAIPARLPRLLPLIGA